MDKTHGHKLLLRRLFLIEKLPAPLTPRSSHLQIFDNYIENTRLRLRTMRSPETKQWTYVLQQRVFFVENPAHLAISEIYLNEAEHHAFEIFEGREIRKNERVESNEIRKNRYFYETENHTLEIDIFLGLLWGLNTAQIFFETEKDLTDFKTPPFFIAEVTANPFFRGENLVGKHFTDVQAELAETNR